MSETKTTEMKATKRQFKAEIKKLLDILVHSLYTNKEIFLRELISNASDAMDKIRFESNKGTDYIDKDLPLEINIWANKDKNILYVQDHGIGMTRDELIKNLGTIAKSGTEDFLKAVTENKDNASNIIGRFGIGFYSVFMVAKKVIVKTKSYLKDEPAMEWESDGMGGFTVKPLNEEMKRGTIVEIHLKDDAKEFTEKYRLESIVKKHSSFISFPIKIEKERVNTIPALWREPKSSIKKEQYVEFYKFLTYDTEEPLDVIHTSVDAPIQFSALLFIPKRNLDWFGITREDYGLDLYVRRVLIQHKNKDLLPEYLGFVKGVVDSEDLPLNISRETLQEDIIFTKISNNVTSQVLSHLTKMAEKEPGKYKQFWEAHGKIFRLGYSDYANQDKFMKLLRFNSSSCKDEKELISLDDYVEKMHKKQKEIYYILGSSRAAIEMDPHMEIFKRKGIEVLYLYDPLEEFALSSLMKYKDYEFKSVDQVDVKKLNKLDDVEKNENEMEPLSKDDEKHFSSLLQRIKNILGERVTDVRESKRLLDSPAVLVNPDNSISSTMQKIMHITGQTKSIPKKIMEINKNHKLIRNLLKVYKANDKDEYITNVAEQLYESALLMEGYLTDPHKLVNRINKLLEQSSEWYTAVKKL